MRSRECSHCQTAKQEIRRLEAEVKRLETENRRLQREKEELEEKAAQLQEALEKARRSGKRQAAPFSKGAPSKKPRRPGRRAGADYGRRAHRPPPERVDRTVDAPLPDCCPDCGEAIEEIKVVPQYHTDLPPVRPEVTQFNVYVGRCKGCKRRIQGRHQEQTSDALGAAASQVGPKTLALAADLNKGLGLPFGKVQGLFADFFGISITRGGICQAVHRVARAAEPTYEALRIWVRQAPVVSPDETGWKVGGTLRWLWVFVTQEVTVYAILPGRGFPEAASVLDEDFEGKLARDGWAPYRKFKSAIHQTCLGHLLGRCEEILETAVRGAARVPLAVKSILQHGLGLRDRRDAGEISPHGLDVATGMLRARMDRLLEWNPTVEDNRKLLQHLRNENDALFTFLEHPDVPATNWWAEQAIRPAVVTRKVCGGNRTWAGAHTQEVLASVLRTCRQQQRDPYPILIELLRSPDPTVAQILEPSWVSRPEDSGPDPPAS